MLSQSLEYRPDIDGLRAVAVLSVVVYHAFPGGLNAGFLGVDVFFVISGYLITKIIHKDIKNGSFSIRQFYSRRIRRIFPALFLVLGSTLVFGFLFLFPSELANLGKHVFFGAIFASNFVLWSEVGYFDASAWEKILLHLWSLAVEEQFYIIWPFALYYAFIKCRRQNLFLLSLFAGSFFLYIVLYRINPTAAFYFSPSRFWELLAGACVALFAKPWTKRAIVSNIAAGSACFVLFAGIVAGDEHDPSLPFVTLFVVLASAFLIWIGPASWFNRVLLSNRAMVWFGLISYPLYLWHWPILAFLRIGQDGSIVLSYPVGIAAIVVSVFLAWATYRFVERGLRFNPSGLTVPSLASSIALSGALGLAISLGGGLASRIQVDPPAGVTLFEDYPHPQNDSSCDDRYAHMKDFWACVVTRPDEVDLVLIGDSHANQYIQSFRKLTPGQTVLNISEPGCLPFNGFGSQSCLAMQRRILSFLEMNENPPTVLLTGYFSFLAAGFAGENREGERVARPLTPETEKLFLENGRWFLSELVQIGVPIYVLGDIPDLIDRPAACLSVEGMLISHLRIQEERWVTRRGDDCFISFVDYKERIEPHDTVLSNLLAEFPQVRFFAARDVLCRGEECFAMRDATPLYWNSDHLTLEGADLVVGAALERFPRLIGH